MAVNAALPGGARIYAAWHEPSIYPAWRESSIYPAWRVQCLSRLAGPVFIPLGGSSVYPAWRVQHLSRLADPAFIPLGANPAFIPLGTNPAFIPLGANPAFIPLGANPAFIPLDESSVYPAWRVQCLSRLAAHAGTDDVFLRRPPQRVIRHPADATSTRRSIRLI